MDRLAVAVRVFWFLVFVGFAFGGLWCSMLYFRRSLWYTACDQELRERRYIGWFGGLLLSAAAVIFVGVFC